MASLLELAKEKSANSAARIDDEQMVELALAFVAGDISQAGLVAALKSAGYAHAASNAVTNMGARIIRLAREGKIQITRVSPKKK